MIKGIIKKILLKIIYGKKASSESYIKYLKRNGCVIGEGTYIYDSKNALIDETSLEFIEIGKNVQITPKVTILAHDYSYSILSDIYKDLPRVQKKTIIGNNVFIGTNATILMGTNIGDNVIIGAGSVVNGIVECDSVYVGNPAKKICSIEEYYERSSSIFEKSAKIYVEGFIKRFGRIPEINEIGPYKALFINQDIEYKSNIGIKEENLKEIKLNMSKRARYEKIEEILEKIN